PGLEHGDRGVLDGARLVADPEFLDLRLGRPHGEGADRESGQRPSEYPMHDVPSAIVQKLTAAIRGSRTSGRTGPAKRPAAAPSPPSPPSGSSACPSR